MSGPAERFQATVIVADSHAALAREEWELMAEAQRHGRSVEYVDPSLCRIYRVTPRTRIEEHEERIAALRRWADGLLDELALLD
jgi:hypothetical protein